MPCLTSFFSKNRYDINRINERGDSGEPLILSFDVTQARVKDSGNVWERYADFFASGLITSPFLGEGDTPLLKAPESLQKYTGLCKLYLKDETRNPTGSFKDRGTKLLMNTASTFGEKYIATISTGNMGHSISAYAANAGHFSSIVIVPSYVPESKLIPMLSHNADVLRVVTDHYSHFKQQVIKKASCQGIRISTGNNPFRVEGYKSTSFEIFEQTHGVLPDYITLPVSACGHIRGLHKGFLELLQAGYISILPRFIIVQAKKCSPVVSALEQNNIEVIPFRNTGTIAHAITSGEPYGGKEIIRLAHKNSWLFASVSEQEIIASKQMLLSCGYNVEYSSATVIGALKQLRDKGTLSENKTVTAILTGTGLKEISEDNFTIPSSVDESSFLKSINAIIHRSTEL